MPKSLVCPKCNGKMIEGFVPDFKENLSNSPLFWIEGEPEKVIASGTDENGKMQLPIKTHCCRKCGFLEFYAS